MLRPIYIASNNRVVMNVFNFLAHDFVAMNTLRMDPFLPELIGSVRLMGLPVKSKLIQDRLHLLLE